MPTPKVVRAARTTTDQYQIFVERLKNHEVIRTGKTNTGLGQKHIDEVLGPTNFGIKYVWIRASQDTRSMEKSI